MSKFMETLTSVLLIINALAIMFNLFVTLDMKLVLLHSGIFLMCLLSQYFRE
jgi:hypothetical protein